jgi:hypothetical protein
MAIRAVVTRGFGNGTFSGTIADLVLRGYSLPDELTLTKSHSLTGIQHDHALTGIQKDHAMTGIQAGYSKTAKP